MPGAERDVWKEQSREAARTFRIFGPSLARSMAQDSFMGTFVHSLVEGQAAHARNTGSDL